MKKLENLTIQEWQQLFKTNEYCKKIATDSLVESARIEGYELSAENVTAEMVEDYVCGYFCELAELFENANDLKAGDNFIWAFSDFEGKHTYTCECVNKSVDDLIAYVKELDATVCLDNYSFCDIYTLRG